MDSEPLTPLRTTAEAARIVGKAPATLATLRSIGGGPKFVKVGVRCYYRDADLAEWLEKNSRVCASTSDYAGEAAA